MVWKNESPCGAITGPSMLMRLTIAMMQLDDVRGLLGDGCDDALQVSGGQDGKDASVDDADVQRAVHAQFRRNYTT